jgi:magnesium transporter
LLHYPEDTAGGIMAKEFVAVNANSTVEEAIEILRNKREEVENIYQCYVVDDFGKLVGAVSLKELILAKPYSRIREIMDEDIFVIRDDMDQEEVARIFEKYDLVSAPVVNSRHQLIGRITIDDIVDVIQEEAEEDIARYAGIGEEEILDESTWPIIKARIPWLIVAFFGEIVSALVMQMHQATLDQILAAAFFVPLVMAMGGSTGQQSSIIVVRGLATGEIEMRDTRRRLIREIKASILNGLIIAAMIFTIVVIWFGTWQFALILSVTLIIVILNASIFGALIPFAFKKFNIDPANATGPFVATFNDVVGLLIYFGLMTAMLNFANVV